MSITGIKEYLLDLQGNIFYHYTGSGTINLFGSAQSDVVPAYGVMSVFFDDNEWVYTTDHVIRQIKAVYGTPELLIWETYGEGYTSFHTTDQLLKFQQGPAFFQKKYSAIITYYEGLLEQVDKLIAGINPCTSEPSARFRFTANTKSPPPKVNTKPKVKVQKKAPETKMDIETLAKCLDTIRSNINKMDKHVHVHR
jgi:hypothetical protein